MCSTVPTNESCNYKLDHNFQTFALARGVNTMTAIGGTPAVNAANTQKMGNSCGAQTADIYLGKKFYC
jgi:hypothetical protein